MQRIWLACLATLLVFSSGVARAQISDDVVKIGVLTDLSGPAATATGPGSVAAAQMAVDDFGGKVLGKPITVISADHQIKPDIAAGIARQWYDVDQVDLIVDVPVSAVGLAVQNVANDRKKLFITHSTGTADFHGKFCSPYTMQWVFDTHALAVGTAQEVDQARRRHLVLPDRRLRVRPCAGTRRHAGDHAERRQSRRLGRASVRDARPVVVHSAGPGLEGEDHRARQRAARQRQRDQARRRIRHFPGRPADGRAFWC